MSENGTSIISRQTIMSTPWFSLVAKTLSGEEDKPPYYSIQTLDYVFALAVTQNEEVVLVRQYRPAIEDYCLELPAGHVEEGELPEAAARRELLEETGYEAAKVELLGCLAPDTGRLSNRMWCYFCSELSLAQAETRGEAGIEVVLHQWKDLVRDIGEAQFAQALPLAALLLAVLKGKLNL